MEKIQLFPVEFYTFKCPLDLTPWIRHLETTNAGAKYGTNISYTSNLHTLPEYEPLFAWFVDCLEQVRTECQYDCDSLSVTSSWANCALAGAAMRQNYHRHSMSFLSGVFYLTEGVPTIFEDPVIHRTQAQIEVLRKGWRGPFEAIENEPGKLVLFPSWMYHSTPPHWGDNDRWVISFNTLPTGAVNYNTATDSVAHITLNNVEKKQWN